MHFTETLLLNLSFYSVVVLPQFQRNSSYLSARAQEALVARLGLAGIDLN
jgi:hypothetical protein